MKIGGVSMPFADVVIIGSGMAALTAAEQLCEHKNVIIITKSAKERSNSMLAQGGVAAAIAGEDHWKDHSEDTIVAGCFHNNHEAVEILTRDGARYIKDMIHKGMKFDQDDHGSLHLGQEGAHNRRRILHAGGDATGRNLVEFMFTRLKDKVTFIENELALDLIVENGSCIGLFTMNSTGCIQHYFASHVILATGGCGSLYQVSSNDSMIIGDGIAMAYRAGAELCDLEFIQFHPTMLYTENRGNGLVSEAVRGEGAFLVNSSGEKIMQGVHELGDLAPRDIVARAIQRERHEGKDVFLDISMILDFKERFPTITSICQEAGVNIDGGLLPVAPGAHFLMGGVMTDMNGETSIKGLYAIGEVACTGVHGANRLASNSLLEGIVFGHNLANYILQKQSEPSLLSVHHASPRKLNVNLPDKSEIQEMMTKYVGIERSESGLLFAKEWVEQFMAPKEFSVRYEIRSTEQISRINMLTNAWLIITSALVRTESRGGHFRRDFPFTNEKWQQKKVIRQKEEGMAIYNLPLSGVK